MSQMSIENAFAPRQNNNHTQNQYRCSAVPVKWGYDWNKNVKQYK